MSLLDDPPADLGSYVGLGPPDQGDLAGLDVGQDPVDSSCGTTQHRDLGIVLDHPDGCGDLRGPGQSEVRTGVQKVDGEAGPCLVTECRCTSATQPIGHQGDGVLPITPCDHLEHTRALHDPGRLQVGDNERGITIAGHHQHGEPLQRHGLVPTEVGQVGSYRQEEDVDPSIDHGGPSLGEALLEHPVRLRGPVGPVSHSAKRRQHDWHRTRWSDDGLGRLPGVVTGTGKRAGLHVADPQPGAHLAPPVEDRRIYPPVDR